VTLTPHPLLVPWSRKGRAIPLLPLWAVRPVQSFSACTKGALYVVVECFILIFIYIHVVFTRRTIRPSLRTFQKAVIFRKSHNVGQKVLLLSKEEDWQGCTP